MPDATLKKLIQVIASAERPEVRAAVAVAGEIGSGREAGLVQALLASLDTDDVALRASAMESLGKLKAEAALTPLLAWVKKGGPEVEPAAQAVGSLGAKGAKALEKLMVEASPVQRRRIAAALGHVGSESAGAAAVHALLDEDAGVVDAAARSLAAELPNLNPARRRALAGELLAALQDKRQRRLSANSEAAMIRVLAALHEPQTEKLLWSRLDTSHAAPVRASALQALGSMASTINDGRLHTLIACASDADFQVAAPALLLLQKQPVSKKSLAHWQPLLEAPDVATRRLAVEKLGGLDDNKVATALVGQLRHADRQLRESAQAALGKTTAGRQALFEALLETHSAEEAWSLARSQIPYAKDWPTSLRARLFAHACSYREEEDRRADALFFLLRELDPNWTHQGIEDRALALRKKKDYAGSLAYWRLLARDPACGEETRFELAATGLKLSNHDLSPEARHAEPSLGQLARLLQDAGFDLLGRVAKAKWLDAEDLFYVGFHFVEQNRREKEFGSGVLALLVKRSPNSARAKDARRKLKSEGMTG